MARNSTEKDQRSRHDRAQFLGSVDGRRAEVKRYREVLAEYQARAGASDAECDRLCRHAASVATLMEQLDAKVAMGEAVDPGEYSRLLWAYHRTMRKLGLDGEAAPDTDDTEAEPPAGEEADDADPDADPLERLSPAVRARVAEILADCPVDDDGTIDMTTLSGAVLGWLERLLSPPPDPPPDPPPEDAEPEDAGASAVDGRRGWRRFLERERHLPAVFNARMRAMARRSRELFDPRTAGNPESESEPDPADDIAAHPEVAAAVATELVEKRILAKPWPSWGRWEELGGGGGRGLSDRY